MAVIIQIRRDVAASWTTADPILALGEMGYETDTGKLKFGKGGTTPWTSLAYFAGGAAERGGIEYDPLIQYQIGDIVSIGDQIYIIGEDPATPGAPMPIGGDPSNPLENTLSTPVGSMDPERGGLLYDNATDYIAGDIISHVDRVYINISDSTGVAPVVGGNANWKDTTVTGTYVGSWTPSGGDEYPDAFTNGNATNDYYIVDGLVSPYFMTIAPLNGTTIKNGDKMIVGTGFTDEGLAAGSWNYVPGPTIPAEQGGIAYSSATTYSIGDIVGYGGRAYICTQAGTGELPDTVASTYWKTSTSPASQAEVDAGIDNTKFVTSLTLETNDKWATKEDDLSNPTTNGDVLSSTTAGVRTWITPTTTTVNNTLTSTSTTEALSASMGKQLQDTKVTSVDEHGDSTNTTPGTIAILNMVSCTQAQYDVIVGNVGIIPTTVYMITGP